MENRKDNISLLVTSVNFVFALCVLAFAYIAFGDIVAEWFKPSVVITESNTSSASSNKVADFDKVVDGIHVQTGFVMRKVLILYVVLVRLVILPNW